MKYTVAQYYGNYDSRFLTEVQKSRGLLQRLHYSSCGVQTVL